MKDDIKTTLMPSNLYRDYTVHLQIDDESRQYLLQIGHVHEREAGILSGDTIYGTLVLKRCHYPASDHRAAPEPTCPIYNVQLPHSDYYPHA